MAKVSRKQLCLGGMRAKDDISEKVMHAIRVQGAGTIPGWTDDTI